MAKTGGVGKRLTEKRKQYEQRIMLGPNKRFSVLDKDVATGSTRDYTSHKGCDVPVPDGLKVVVAAPGAWSYACSLSNIRPERRSSDGGARRKDHGRRLGACLVYEDFGYALVKAGSR